MNDRSHYTNNCIQNPLYSELDYYKLMSSIFIYHENITRNTTDLSNIMLKILFKQMFLLPNVLTLKLYECKAEENTDNIESVSIQKTDIIQ